MRRIFPSVSIASLVLSLGCGLSQAETVPHPAAYDAFIAQQAKKHDVPERLIHRILMRESRYDPRVFSKHCYGLMQIKYPTAREMGYTGAPKGLFDPYVNMTYAIPYLANAYHIAGGDENRAVALFAGGYYYAAKKKQMLAELRTADSPPLTPEPPPPAPPQQNAMAGLFAFLQNSSVQSQTAPAAQQAPAALAYAAPASVAAPPVAPTSVAPAQQAAAQPPSAPATQAAAAAPAANEAPQQSADAQAVDTSLPTGSLPKTAHLPKSKTRVAALTDPPGRAAHKAREAKAHAGGALAATAEPKDAEMAAAAQEIRDGKSWASEPTAAPEATAK